MKVRTSKALLASRCEYFKNIISGSYSDSDLDNLQLDGMNLYTFKIIYRYLITGVLKTKTNNIKIYLDLLKQADYLMLNTTDNLPYLSSTSLVDLLIIKIQNRLTLSNVFDIYLFAKSYNFTKLSKICIAYISYSKNYMIIHDNCSAKYF